MEKPEIRDREGVDGISKKIEAIAPEEISEALYFVLSKEYGVPETDLIAQTARVVGYKRVTEEMGDYISKVIKKCKDSGHIIKKGDKFLLNLEKSKEEEPMEPPNKIIIPNPEEKQKEKSQTKVPPQSLPIKTKTKTKIVNICPQCHKIYDDTWKRCLQCNIPLGQKEISENPDIIFNEKEVNIKKIIQEAIDNKKAITIKYNSPTKGDSERTIEPFSLEGVYVKAYCHLVKSNRTFRIDRITEIE